MLPTLPHKNWQVGNTGSEMFSNYFCLTLLFAYIFPQVLGMSSSWLDYLQSIFQSASKGSPMTVTINGEKVEELNAIEITQNAADEESPLTCTPECPQEDYEYSYEVCCIVTKI